jgi:ATP-dependent helicase/nuclease subunit B
MFFNQSVRAQLGLPTRDQRLLQITEDLSGLLSRSGHVLVTWQELRNGEQNLISPLFERVEVFHQLAWHTGLRSQALERMLPRAHVRSPRPAPLPPSQSPPAPSVQPQHLPVRISASGYNSLVACPYQFFSRYVLGLREPEEVREEMEKRDYGEYVHRILRRFHARFPVCSDVAREQLETVLREISDEVFQTAVQASYLSHAWALRWRGIVSAYLDWQLERELQGWRFHSAESEHAIDIVLADDTVLRLEGRLDRIDVREAGEQHQFAVIDYKTRAASDLRKAAKEPGEDVQLPVYAALLGEQTRQACYLALDDNQVRMISLEEETFSEITRAIERLANMFARLHGGAPLPAQGIDSTCHYCEMSGLCRKQYWA